MDRVPKRRLAVGSALVAMTMLASAFLAPSTAQAYGDELRSEYALVNTDPCYRRIGSLDVLDRNGRCYVPDDVDGAWFVPDPDGVAMKIELRDRRDNQRMLAKVEWHPHGEHLFVYDTKNDGDAIYFLLTVEGGYARSFTAPGTSASIDYADHDLDFPEGRDVHIDVYDDRARTELIIGLGTGTT